MENIKASVRGIELHRVKGEAPVRVDKAYAAECGGLEGDRHCHDENKQISITGADVLEWMSRCATPGICFQKFGANIIFDRIPDEMLQKGVRLQIGGAVIDIQEVHKKCHVDDCVYFDDMSAADCMLRKYVMYGECISAGEISAGDEVSLLEKRSSTAARKTDLVLIPKEKAFARFMDEVRETVRPETETVNTADALGRTAAFDLRAQYSLPHYDSAAMDGIAVRSGALAGASLENPVFINPGDFVHVNTGNPVEPPYDTVVMAENITEMLDGRMCVKQEQESGKHVRRKGENIAEGELIASRGHTLMPADICALIEAGVYRVEVFRRPRVAIFPTGDEIIDPETAAAAGQPPCAGQIVDANSRFFGALTEEYGGVPCRFPILPDDYESIRDAVSGATEDYDVIVTNAGTSAGLKDFTVQVLKDIGRVLVHGVAIKPGKPCILAIAGGRPVIGLPGNPVAAYHGFMEFVKPVLEYMQGRSISEPLRVKAVLTRDVSSSKRQSEYIRVRLGRRADGRLTAEPLDKGSSSAILLVRGDGYIIAPQLCTEIKAGTEAEVELYRPAGDISALRGMFME